MANATARAIAFNTPYPEAYLYENSIWQEGFIGGDYRWLKDGGDGGRFLDARTMFFYIATVNTPAMTWKLIGKGSQYAWGYLDSKGNYLDGGKNYKLYEGDTAQFRGEVAHGPISMLALPIEFLSIKVYPNLG